MRALLAAWLIGLSATLAWAGPDDDDAKLVATIEQFDCKVTPMTALQLIAASGLPEQRAGEAMERLRAKNIVRDEDVNGVPTIFLQAGKCK